MAYTITTRTQVRDAFWEHHPQFRRRGKQTQNDYPADVRVAFCDFVDHLQREGALGERLASRVTL
jgi:hypothetical protein